MERNRRSHQDPVPEEATGPWLCHMVRNCRLHQLALTAGWNCHCPLPQNWWSAQSQDCMVCSPLRKKQNKTGFFLLAMIFLPFPVRDLWKKKNLTQAPVELGSKCEFMSHGTLQAEVLLSIFRWLISGCVVESSCELWLCFGLAMWHLACSSTEYAKHSAL